MPYNRTSAEVEANACKWWPRNLVALETEASVIPTLVQTQDHFISILTLANPLNINSVLALMATSNFPANLFLKHLMILADFGSEQLQRINRDFRSLFP